MSDAGWQKSAQLFINDKLEREATVGEFARYSVAKIVTLIRRVSIDSIYHFRFVE
jgi:hypothetical protein